MAIKYARKNEMEANLSESYLHEVKHRCELATPEPWISLIEGRDHTSGDSVIVRGQGGSSKDLYLIGASDADQDFIASARQDIPILLIEIERLYKLMRK
jgi:hypothetical protein